MDESAFGHRAPAVGFEAPLEMLAACHHRIEQQCATLRRLGPHLARHGADAQAQAAASGVIRYFDSAAVDHHADEEADLFPALIESMAGSDPVCIREMTGALTAEHRRLEALWDGVRRELAEVAAGRAARLDSAAVEAFTGLYESHVRREDAELLPMAARLLGDDELERVGRAMRERRGIAPVA